MKKVKRNANICIVMLIAIMFAMVGSVYAEEAEEQESIRITLDAPLTKVVIIEITEFQKEIDLNDDFLKENVHLFMEDGVLNEQLFCDFLAEEVGTYNVMLDDASLLPTDGEAMDEAADMVLYDSDSYDLLGAVYDEDGNIIAIVVKAM